MRELTEGRYFGKLYAPQHWIKNFGLFTRAEFKSNAEELIQIINSEFSHGNIREIPRSVEYHFPILMFCYNPNTCARHVITSTLSGSGFINDGVLVDSFPSGFNNVAGLEIHES